MFCGYTLAAISVAGALKSAATVTLVVPILALGVPIFDTIFAIARRIYNRKPIGEADNGHIPTACWLLVTINGRPCWEYMLSVSFWERLPS